MKRPGTLENSFQPRLVHSRPSGDVARAAALVVAGEDGFLRVGRRAASMAPVEACCRCHSMTDDENTARFRGKPTLPPTDRVDSVPRAIGRSLHEWKAAQGLEPPSGFWPREPRIVSTLTIIRVMRLQAEIAHAL